jgi:cytidine deaminase
MANPMSNASISRILSMHEVKFEQLENWQQSLLLQAESIMKNAYNLYSHFYVGSAVLTIDGTVYLGTFAENSSQGGTICAERAAILAANTNKARAYKAIAVIGAGETFDCHDPVMPCGMCRQFIYDFSQIAKYDTEIICSNTKKDRVYLTTINELLPYAFGPKDLKHDLERFR